MRATDIPDDIKEKINRYLVRNRSGFVELDEESDEEEKQAIAEMDHELREIHLDNEPTATKDDGSQN